MSVDIEQFISWANGRAIPIPGYAELQCVGPFREFNLQNAGEPYSAVGATNLWDKAWTSYQKVPLGQRGDWAIWSGSVGAYTNGGYGHVALLLSDNGNGTGQFLSQNPGPTQEMTLEYNGILGFLRQVITHDATPPPPDPEPTPPAEVVVQRVVGDAGVNYREEPNSAAGVITTFNAGVVTNWKGFVLGEDPYGDGNNRWLVGAFTGKYAWSGGFTDPSTDGLPQL